MNSSYAKLERIAGFPLKYSPSNFFLKYVSAYLSPIYRSTADSLSRIGGPGFLKVWAWESENLLRECGVEEALGETQDYATHHREFAYPGISFRLSEIYRSAFLRTLAWFHVAGHLSEERFRTISLNALPVDLSLWEVTSQAPPDWWPRSAGHSIALMENSEDLRTAAWPEIRDLVNLDVGSFGGSPGRILAAEGARLCENNRETDRTQLNFTLIGFGYKVIGSTAPVADEVAYMILYGSRYLPRSYSPYGAAVLDAAANNALAHGPYSWRAVNTMEIIAVISRLESHSIHTWQWYRAFNRPFALSPFLAQSGCILHRKHSSWGYVEANREVARFYDWRIGALEQDPKNSFPTHGQVAEVDFDWLSEKLHKNSLNLGYLLQIELKIQKRSYESAKEFTHTELINVGRIIKTPER